MPWRELPRVALQREPPADVRVRFRFSAQRPFF